MHFLWDILLYVIVFTFLKFSNIIKYIFHWIRNSSSLTDLIFHSHCLDNCLIPLVFLEWKKKKKKHLYTWERQPICSIIVLCTRSSICPPDLHSIFPICTVWTMSKRSLAFQFQFHLNGAHQQEKKRRKDNEARSLTSPFLHWRITLETGQS